MESNFVIFYFDTVLHTLYHGTGISILKSVVELRLILQHCDKTLNLEVHICEEIYLLQDFLQICFVINNTVQWFMEIRSYHVARFFHLVIQYEISGL